MKKLLLLPLALAFAANTAMAANSVDLRVTGTITPAACNISVTGGDFDLGSIPGNTLSSSARTTLPENSGKTLDIACTGATQVAFKAIDNRESSVPTDLTQSDVFGLGTDAASNPIGYYHLKLITSATVVDGATGDVSFSNDDGANWNAANGGLFHVASFSRKSQIYALDSSTNGSTDVPVPITNGTIQIKVNPSIEPSSTLDTSTDIAIDGSATIELVYL